MLPGAYYAEASGIGCLDTTHLHAADFERKSHVGCIRVENKLEMNVEVVFAVNAGPFLEELIVNA